MNRRGFLTSLLALPALPLMAGKDARKLFVGDGQLITCKCGALRATRSLLACPDTIESSVWTGDFHETHNLNECRRWKRNGSQIQSEVIA